jgi:hypothetical protein
MTGRRNDCHIKDHLKKSLVEKCKEMPDLGKDSLQRDIKK